MGVSSYPPVATATTSGLVPTPPNNTTTFLRGDSTFAAAGGTDASTRILVHDLFSGEASSNSFPLRYTTNTSGSGTLVLGSAGASIETGATNPSNAQFYIAVSNTINNVYTGNPSFSCSFRVNAAKPAVDVYWSIGKITQSGTSTTYTGSHAGFKVVYVASVATLSATQSDNTTENATDITSGITVTSSNTYRCLGTDSTNFKYYINGSLKATQSLNMPTGTTNGYIMSCGATNEASTSDFLCAMGWWTYWRDESPVI